MPQKHLSPILFMQNDPMWADNIYSNHNDRYQTMARCGQAPTLCADIVATLKSRELVNPWTLAQQSMEWGCRTYNCGTAWSFYDKVAEHYGFRRYVRSESFKELQKCVDTDGYAICFMRNGDNPLNTRLLLVWDYGDDFVYIASSRSRNTRKWSVSHFRLESRMYFCYYPDLIKSEVVQ